ncbi:hypothetical protein O2W18_17315 [Modestobacter sp. VKM Ac-2983]|uniref:hypothetical protein n=1 Tax=Modestobacter sp. VKM Ac-2983 TaxID=3004137 RepID=UPI0022ABA2C6|nr:hypothetical protein [Modestobacter sp. VKM Ac-2983]MCZ2806869.1 hypothetical protein [Modestobacter sp. VKM Ac-2983]
MLDDRGLDTRLAAAAVVTDSDLSALPEGFLAHLMSDADPDPATVVALRQLIADAHEERYAPRRPRPRRRTVLRLGAAVVALASAWTTAVLVTASDPAGSQGGGTAAPADGITLAAAQEITFPVSLEPAPDGLTPLFSQWGGVPPLEDEPLTYTADYRQTGEDGYGDGFTLSLYPDDPRETGAISEWPAEGTRVATVTVDGTEAQVATDGDSAALLWQRSDDWWVVVRGDGDYGDADEVVDVAESVVDRPQPIDLQFGLAPAGWTLNSLEESRSIDLSSDVDPEQRIKLSRYLPGFGLTIDDVLDGMEPVQSVETVTVQGMPARLARAQPGADAPVSWYVTGQFPDGSLFLLVTPDTLTAEQVLQIADEVTYTP